MGSDRDIDWRGLVRDIELLAKTGCYEKVNNFLSLGNVDSLRRNASLLVAREGVLGDLGGGPGTSTRALDRVAPENSVILLLDPSIDMLEISLSNIPSARVVRVGGRFERLPFTDDSISGIVAMFSFRDAVDHRRALDEMARVLRTDGRLAILDIYRPENPAVHFIVKAYIALMVPLAILFNRCPFRYLNMYKSFLRSIDRMLTDKELLRELSARFERTAFFPYLPGAGIFYAERPRGPPS